MQNYSKISYLFGHVISEGIRTDPGSVKAVIDVPRSEIEYDIR